MHDEHHANFKKILLNDIYKHNGTLIYPDYDSLDYNINLYNDITVLVPVKYIDRIELLMKDHASRINPYYLQWIDDIYSLPDPNIDNEVPTEITFYVSSVVFHDLEDVNRFEIVSVIAILLLAIGVIGLIFIAVVWIDQKQYEKSLSEV